MESGDGHDAHGEMPGHAKRLRMQIVTVAGFDAKIAGKCIERGDGHDGIAWYVDNLDGKKAKVPE
jgi:hypothetical protein